MRVLSSGRLRAASRNVFTFCARNATSFPERSSNMNWNPPEVPTPGITGGGKANAIPSLRLESDKEKRVVGVRDQAQQTKADDTGRILHARCFAQKIFDLSTNLVGALKRSRIG